MSEATFTKADVDAAIAAAKEAQDEKNRELLAEVKDLKNKLRATQEIKPEDLTAAEARAEKAEAALKEAQKQIGTLTKERENLAKTLEAESGAARSYALEAEISDAIAKGNVVPALVPAFKAMIQQQAKAELVDGKYAVTIGDKAAREYISAYLDSDEGKAFKVANANHGGGATGGKGNGTGAKQITRAEYNALSIAEQATIGMAAAKGEMQIIEQAA